ncbi:hypothetical protein ACF0H5_000304 [Mactra antiquata]
MKTSLFWISLFSVIFCSTINGTKLKLQNIKEAKHLLGLTLNSLKSSLEFLNKEYNHVNLDAIIGTRLVDGTLKVLLYHIRQDLESWSLDESTIKHIQDLQMLAETLSDKAIPYVQQSDPMYYSRLGTLLAKDFWTLDFASKDFYSEDFLSAWLPQPGEAMHEQDSDNCITELLGTGANTRAKCQISFECWQKMTEKGYSGYSLTHQTFYLMIAYQMGCHEEMNKHRTLLGQPPPADLVKAYCASTFLEAEEIYKNKFPELRRDLFMEQAALCGAMGYRWFFSPDWLLEIISWQDQSSGCYKGETITESEVKMRETMEQHSTSRVKREEKVLTDGCLSHKTTVAASALSMYVRYITEYLQMMFERDQMYTDA